MSRRCQIFETLGSIKEMKSGQSSDGLMTLSGTFGVCGIRNNNKRVYETANYSKMVTEMQNRLKNGLDIKGELEHPQAMTVNLERVSHLITDININEQGVVTGTIKLLDTPQGKIAQAIVEGGGQLFVSSRATGQIDKNGNVTLEHLETYDLVGSPGFSQAKMKLNEGLVCESAGDNFAIIAESAENNTDNNMNENNSNQSIDEKIEHLVGLVNGLVEENQELKEQLESLQKRQVNEVAMARALQQWVIHEHTPALQEWMEQEFTKKAVQESAKAILIDGDLGGKTQDWIIKTIIPTIENWVKEDYGKKIENWMFEQIIPGIQTWAKGQFAPEIEEYVGENFVKKGEVVETKNTSNNLEHIKEMLNVIASIDPAKPTFNSSRTINEGAQANENVPEYIANMPEDCKAKYNMASKELKEYIDCKARITNFLTEGAFERFWNSIDWNKTIEPAKDVYEGLENIKDLRERSIREAFRRRRH